MFAAVGDSRREIGTLKEMYRGQIVFYASTRTYGKVLATHGWEDVGERLHALSVRGDWKRMSAEVGEDMLAEFVVEGRWDEMGAVLKRRYRGFVDRVRLYAPFDGKAGWKSMVRGFRA